jgi:hypothetical protein
MMNMTQKPPLDTREHLASAISCKLGGARLDHDNAAYEGGRWSLPVEVDNFDAWSNETGALVAAAHRANPNMHLLIDESTRSIVIQGPRSSKSGGVENLVRSGGRFLSEVRERFQSEVPGEKPVRAHKAAQVTAQYFNGSNRVWGPEKRAALLEARAARQQIA